MAMTSGRLLEFDGGIPPGLTPMIRLFLLGVLLIGFVLGLQKGWVTFDWAKMRQDLNITFPTQP
jgi:hypothetical protein